MCLKCWAFSAGAGKQQSCAGGSLPACTPCNVMFLLEAHHWLTSGLRMLRPAARPRGSASAGPQAQRVSDSGTSPMCMLLQSATRWSAKQSRSAPL